MRLIDAERFEELFNQQVEFGATDLFDAVDDALQDTESIDPKTLPLVQELRAQLARVTEERDKALRYEHLDELKLCLESSRDINLVYIPRSLAEKVAVESMNLEKEISKVTAERDAAISDLYAARSCCTCELRSTTDCMFEYMGESCSDYDTPGLPYKWRGIQEVQEDE